METVENAYGQPIPVAFVVMDKNLSKDEAAKAIMKASIQWTHMMTSYGNALVKGINDWQFDYKAKGEGTIAVPVQDGLEYYDNLNSLLENWETSNMNIQTYEFEGKKLKHAFDRLKLFSSRNLNGTQLRIVETDGILFVGPVINPVLTDIRDIITSSHK